MSQILEIVAQTDAGMVRSHNEDSVLADAPHGLVILADGMGGYNAGEVASGMATTLLGNNLLLALKDPAVQLKGTKARVGLEQLLHSEVLKTNNSIYNAASTQPQYAGMGTTLVMAVAHDNGLTVAHIGDSRLYRLRGDEFTLLTRDHSLLQEQLDSGIITAEQAKHSQNKNLVTRALGVDPLVVPEIQHFDVQEGDLYLLCSDGLNDMVEDDEIAMALQALGANLELCASQLIQMANDNGGRDNVSVILLRVKQFAAVKQGWLAKLLAWFN